MSMELATLDDPEAVSAADPGGMLRLVGSLGTQLRQGFDAGSAVSGAWTQRPTAVVVCGMGGSGIAGDLVRALVEELGEGAREVETLADISELAE